MSGSQNHHAEQKKQVHSVESVSKVWGSADPSVVRRNLISLGLGVGAGGSESAEWGTEAL